MNSFLFYSEAEGQAMMKIRDQADRKALEKLGLIEPDDPVKALELGFPKRQLKPLVSSSASDDEPVPMPLGDLPNLVESLMKAANR